ncbi:MAG: hypothetical protein R3A80_06510 [Bdellovibrionota bacterium]
MSSFKNFIVVAACGVFIYYNVDDVTRAKIDNGIESQNILVSDIKHNTYLVLWEFFGAHEDEIAREVAAYNQKMNKRKKALLEKKEAAEGKRTPAEDDAHKYDKFLAK